MRSRFVSGGTAISPTLTVSEREPDPAAQEVEATFVLDPESGTPVMEGSQEVFGEPRGGAFGPRSERGAGSV